MAVRQVQVTFDCEGLDFVILEPAEKMSGEGGEYPFRGGVVITELGSSGDPVPPAGH